ncbi:glycoside hydrolase family 2 protein [Pedobacter aquae]|uniref:Glycoside hydrolase family 2 protein n=1 Tax=Pedobacter aquae TaxID=2605747 RepID=A0A5C0VLZ1_9SPHI|nr:sugar-binding domain-containing protein [Pedobacter aquae]QEK53149.1 glycoside hydrolase family 2 protein [Pedobacter aquae]
MRKYRYRYFSLFLGFTFLSVFCTSIQAQTQERAKYNFNAAWKLFVGDVAEAQSPDFNDKDWKAVTLPSAWNEDAAFKLPIHEHPTGIVWYRKHFVIPASAKGNKVFLEFEGIRQAGDFYVNGKHIGFHENGITAFGFDISDVIKPGEENIIAVRIDNAWDYRERATKTKYQWSDKNFNANYGGITKNVWLHVTSKLYQTLPLFSSLQTTGPYIYGQNFNIAKKRMTLVAQTEVKNEYQEDKIFDYEVEVKDIEGKIIKLIHGGKVAIKAGETKEIKAQAALTDVNFWSWGYGYLYTINTKLKINGQLIDEVATKTGFRKVEYQNGMVYLNDRVLMMKGYAQRTSNEWPALGLSVAPWLSDYSNGLMVESNANLVRWMHIAPWKQDIESCDRVGLIQAMPAGDAEADVQGVRWQQRVQVMQDAIIYNRNAPSIFFYESGNDGISEAHMLEMKALKEKYDPHGGRAIGSREMLDSKVAEYGGEMLYINKSADIPLWATEYSRDEGLRKYWDEFSPPFHKDGDGPLYKNMPAREYNRNQDSHAIENVIRWFDYWRERPGTGKRVSSGGVNIIFSDSNTHFRGEENYRRSGEVDALRIAKDGFYAHQVMWDGWVDVENHRVHIIGHWNYQKGTVKNIYVIASGEKTELFINGKSKGYGERSHNFLFTFKNIAWEPGVIKAISYDAAGKILAQKEIKTAGEPYALRLSKMMNPVGFKADGADLVLAEVEVIDQAGNRCPTALNMINFSLEGEAEWRGGLAQGADNYILAKNLPVECGVNRVLIRSTTNAGKIMLTAKAAGLQSALLEFSSIPVKVEGGLSKEMPADGLKPLLKRGPTPLSPSYQVSGKTLEIKSIKAGANQDVSFASIDDNELSDWSNDGNLATAWITYTFKEASVVNELNLKLNNFRTRIYPLQIKVDDQVVFEGNTQKSLGYFKAICKPVKGKTLTIRLMRENSGKDDSQIAAEMGGKKLDDGIARNDANAKGKLSIIEVEIIQIVK